MACLNEYNGECYCPLCQDAFRSWLRDKYKGDLDELNRQWWTGFWSHTYTSWEQIQPPSPLGEMSTHGLNLDWKRFITAQTVDFMKKRDTASQGDYTPYPRHHQYDGNLPRSGLPPVSGRWWTSSPGTATPQLAQSRASRSCRRIPPSSMTSTALSGTGSPLCLWRARPAHKTGCRSTSWKKPGMHELASLQAMAHGADTVQYFQWAQKAGRQRKVSRRRGRSLRRRHYPRVFRDVAQVGT